MFVKKYEIIININNNISSNKLLAEYYKYYHNIVSYISNLDNITDISIAMSYMIDDYNDNEKHLYNIIKEIDINISNKHTIKSILNIFNNMIYNKN
jgi:hypothetical protein